MNKFIGLKIVGFDLEIGLRVIADGAYSRSFLANDDVTAVATLPNHFLIAGENNAAFDVGQ
jgi:hypothetical protein